MYTKLDTYDYKIMRYPSGRPYLIKIYVESESDVIIQDILSGLIATNGKGYVEGNYFDVVDKQLTTTSEEGSILRLALSNVH